MNSKTSYVSRVNQLDAIHFDEEIFKILRNDFTHALGELWPVVTSRYQPEIDLLLRSIIWCGSVGRNFSTFGQDLLLICYNKDKITTSKLYLHFIFTVLGRYIQEISDQKFIESIRIRKALKYARTFMLLASILNFFRFLRSGHGPSISDFTLGLPIINKPDSTPRSLSYNHMIRELTWSALMELIVIVIPLINYRKARRYIRKLYPFSKKVNDVDAEVKFDEFTLCVHCNHRPVLPHVIGCSHVFCFFCIFGNLKADNEYVCPVCYKPAKLVKPFRIEKSNC